MQDKNLSLVGRDPSDAIDRRDGMRYFATLAPNFDEHIERSIRGYADLRADVIALSRHCIVAHTHVLDLGCAQGSLLAAIAQDQAQTASVQYLGVDINPAFERHWQSAGAVRYLVDDIVQMALPDQLSFVSALFTFQFLARGDRLPLMRRIYDNLVDGGALVVGEKVLAADSGMQSMLDGIYHDYKRQHFSAQQILDKARVLQNLLRLVDESSLRQQLQAAGFQAVHPFWRNHNFVGYIAQKNPAP